MKNVSASAMPYVCFLSTWLLLFLGMPSQAEGTFPSSECSCAESAAELPFTDPSSFPPDVNASTYGIGCKAHDQHRSLCNLPGKECTTLIPVPSWCHDDLSWCPNQWCYIKDPVNCSLNYHRSYIFSAHHFGYGRYYSYATCGYRDFFTLESQAYSLKGQVLKVGYRSTSEGWKSAYNRGGNVVDSNWYGPVVDLLAAAAEEGGFTLNTTDAPAEVLAMAPSNSSHHQCAYAAGLGYLDVCACLVPMNDFYVSAAEFYTVLTESVFMVSPVIKTPLWKKIWGFTRPFTTGLWCAIVLFIILMSVLLMQQESQERDGQFGGMRMGMRVYNTLYFAFAGMTSGGVMHEPVSLGGKMINVGFGVFILLVVSTYTANLAADLVTSLSGPKFSDFQEVLSDGVRICGTTSNIDLLTSVYPSAVTHKVHLRKKIL